MKKIIKKLVLIIILSVLIIASYKYAVFTKNQEDRKQYLYNEVFSDNFYFQTLNDIEKDYYRLLYEASIKYDTSFKTFEELDLDSLKNAIEALKFDYPLFYWWSTGLKSTKDNYFVYSTSVSDDAISLDVLNNVQNIDVISNNIIYGCVEEDNYKTILNIHDYLVNNLEYKETDNAHNIVGSLIENECVCDGYAYAFKYLMDKLEIPCIIVKGNAIKNDNDSRGHAWNIIKLNDDWYNVDITWDDLVNDDKDITYEYFLCNDDVILINHIKEEYDYPKCNDNSLYLKQLPAIYLEEFNKDEIWDFILYNLPDNKKTIYIKFKNREDIENCVSWLHEEKGFIDIFEEFYGPYYSLDYELKNDKYSYLLAIYYSYSD